jgi:hypothetical protein
MSIKICIAQPTGLETKFICPLGWSAEVKGANHCRFALINEQPTLLCKASHQTKITIKPVWNIAAEGHLHIIPSPNSEVFLTIPRVSNINVNQREDSDEIFS